MDFILQIAIVKGSDFDSCCCLLKRLPNQREMEKGRWREILTLVCVATMVMACHVLPWRETDTHGSFAVEADLPRWGAHDDGHPLPHTVRENSRERMKPNEKNHILRCCTVAVTSNYNMVN